MDVTSFYGKTIKSDIDGMYVLDYGSNTIELYDDASHILSIGQGFFARDTIYNFRNNGFIGMSLDDFTRKPRPFLLCMWMPTHCLKV